MIYEVQYYKEGVVYGTQIESICEKFALEKAKEMNLENPSILGVVCQVIPTKEDGFTANWDKAVDFESQMLN